MKMTRWLTTVCLTMLLTPGLALGQEMAKGESGAQTLQQAQVADLETMKGKFTSLAEAFPADTWEWSPMEGVRSVKGQMVLVAAEGYLFPTMWGYDAPEGVKSQFGEEMARIGAMSQAEIVAELNKSYDHVIGIVKDMSEEDRARDVRFFGRTVHLGTAVTLMGNDMHEHLGKAIAYARMNEVVPPWSRPSGQ